MSKWTLRVLMGVTLMAHPLGAMAGEISATSSVRAVTVYLDRAMVTRQAKIELPEGDSVIVLDDMPGTLLADSIRAEGHHAHGAKVVLGAVESRQVNSSSLSAPQERVLNDKLVAIKDQLARIVADQETLKVKKQFLDTISQHATAQIREEMPKLDMKPDQWTKAADSLAGEIGKIAHEALAKAIEQRQLERQIEAAEAELRQVQTGTRTTYQIRIPVAASAPSQLTLDVGYQIPGASWAPLYDARLDTASGKLALTQFAQVRQRTGEDWDSVKLTLSTAQPSRGSAFPALSPLWVDYRRPSQLADDSMLGGVAMRMKSQATQAMGGKARMEEVAEAPAAPVPMPAPEEQSASFNTAQLHMNGTVSEYEVPGIVSVKTDGTERKVMIGDVNVAGSILAKIQPQRMVTAFLIFRAKLGGEATLLPGEVQLFRDGAFVGMSDMPLMRPGEQRDLSFGIDDQIVVRHKVVKDESGETGLVKREQTRARHTVTQIQNLHTGPIKVITLQNVPASRQEQIRLTVSSDETTPGYEKDVEHYSGVLGWTQELAPKQEAEIKLGWTLTWPKDMPLSGLPF